MGELMRLTQRDKKRAKRGEHRIICCAPECPRNRNDHCTARQIIIEPDLAGGGARCGFFERFRMGILYPDEFPPVEETWVWEL